MSNTVEIRNAVKKVAIEVGLDNITYDNIKAIKEAYSCSTTSVQNAINYFRYSPQQKAFRERYITY